MSGLHEVPPPDLRVSADDQPEVELDPARNGGRALRSHVRDLAALLALPALWRGREPEYIVDSLLDVMMSLLRLDVAYVRFDDAASDPPLEAWRPKASEPPIRLARMLEDALAGGEALVTLTASDGAGPGPLQWVGIRPGVVSAGGLVAAGSRRPDFPTEIESYLLRVAIDQAVIALDTAVSLRREQVERAAAEAARQRYLDLVQGLDAIVWEADAATFQFIFVSQRAEDLLGYPIERWLQEPRFWADHIHPEDRTWAVQYCLDCTAKAEDHQFEYRMRAADGRVVWLRDIVHVVTDAAGLPVHLRGVMVDITEQKLTEQRLALQHSVARVLAEAGSLSEGTLAVLRAIGESLGWRAGAFWTVDRAAGVLRCVETWQEHGVDVAAFVERTRASTFPPGVGLPGRVWEHAQPAWIVDVTHDSNFPRAPFATAVGLHGAFGFPVTSVGRVLGVVEFFSPQIREPDGQLLVLMDAIGRQLGQFVERKRTEEALREEREALAVINRVGQVLAAELDLDKLVQAATDAATELAGAEVGAFFYNAVNDQGEAYLLYALSGAPKEAFAAFPMPRNTALFAPTFRGEGVVRLDDVTRDPRYGQNPPYHGTPPGHLPVRSYLAVPVVSRSGEVLGGLFFGHARTAMFTERAERLVTGLASQVAIAMDNARLYRRAQQAVETRDEFLAAVSHDLKNPLGVLRGVTQLLQRRVQRLNLPEAQPLADGLARIDHTVTRMVRMIETLLDVARLQLGESLPLEQEPTDLVAVVRRVAMECQDATDRHRLSLDVTVPRLLGVWDAARVERAIENIVGNAIKYSPNGGEVTLQVSQEEWQGRSWAILSIRDQGIGIPAADLPRVFERFHRASNVIGQVAGTGMGLAAARQIVEQHHGRIEIESQEGQGTTVTLWLPVAPETAPPPASAPPL